MQFTATDPGQGTGSLLTRPEVSSNVSLSHGVHISDSLLLTSFLPSYFLSSPLLSLPFPFPISPSPTLSCSPFSFSPNSDGIPSRCCRDDFCLIIFPDSTALCLTSTVSSAQHCLNCKHETTLIFIVPNGVIISQVTMSPEKMCVTTAQVRLC